MKRSVSVRSPQKLHPESCIHGKQRADFVVAEAVDVEFVDVVAGAVDDELAHVVVPKREGESSGAVPGR